MQHPTDERVWHVTAADEPIGDGWQLRDNESNWQNFRVANSWKSYLDAQKIETTYLGHLTPAEFHARLAAGDKGKGDLPVLIDLFYNTDV